MMHYVSRVFVLAFGAGYPAYKTYKVTKTRDLQEHKRWLIYWIVYATFICIEPLLDILAYIVPFYFTIKMAFLYWLVVPSGSTIVYNIVIFPILSSKEKDIDAGLNKIRTEHLDGIANVIQDILAKVANLVTSTAADKAKSGNVQPEQPIINGNNNPAKH